MRALAAFLVFSWHFLHINNGQKVPLSGTFDFFAFSIFAEGHTGVSIFMVLSGYLFAKITRKRRLNYGRFFRDRAIRLLPLLIAVRLLVVLKDYILLGPEAAASRLKSIGAGVVMPTLPNGGWSITVEFYFYLLFPILMMIERRQPFGALLFLLLGFLVRLLVPWIWPDTSVQDVAYWTIFGQVDQFVIGILMAYHGRNIAGQHWLAILSLMMLLTLYAWFDRLGGFYGNDTRRGIWLWLLTAEGVFYAILIGWYDRSFTFSESGIGGLVAKVGAASYSIYLLHVFFVFRMAAFSDGKIIKLDNFYLAFAANILCFVPVALIGWFSYRFFELYRARFRRPYLDRTPAQGTGLRQGRRESGPPRGTRGPAQRRTGPERAG